MECGKLAKYEQLQWRWSSQRSAGIGYEELKFLADIGSILEAAVFSVLLSELHPLRKTMRSSWKQKKKLTGQL